MISFRNPPIVMFETIINTEVANISFLIKQHKRWKEKNVAHNNSDYKWTNGSCYKNARKNNKGAYLLNYKQKSQHEVHTPSPPSRSRRRTWPTGSSPRKTTRGFLPPPQGHRRLHHRQRRRRGKLDPCVSERWLQAYLILQKRILIEIDCLTIKLMPSFRWRRNNMGI